MEHGFSCLCIQKKIGSLIFMQKQQAQKEKGEKWRYLLRNLLRWSLRYYQLKALAFLFWMQIPSGKDMSSILSRLQISMQASALAYQEIMALKIWERMGT